MTALALPVTLPPMSPWPTGEIIDLGRQHAATLFSCPMRARLVAFDALHTLYPGFGTTRLGIRLGFTHPARAADAVGKAKARSWWDECAVDEVIGFLVSPQYGERAL